MSLEYLIFIKMANITKHAKRQHLQYHHSFFILFLNKRISLISPLQGENEFTKLLLYSDGKAISC